MVLIYLIVLFLIDVTIHIFINAERKISDKKDILGNE